MSNENSVFIIGGCDRNSMLDRELSTIMQYSDNIWTHVGDLHTARKKHSAISSGSIVMIVGGSDGNAYSKR